MSKWPEGAPQGVWDAVHVRLKAHGLKPKHLDVACNRCYKEPVWCVSFNTADCRMIPRFYWWYFKPDGSTRQEPWKQ